MSAEQEPEPPSPSSLSPVLAVIMIAIPAAVILGFWLNARLIHGWGPLIATWAYAIFATIFVWLDRSSTRKLAAGPPIDEVTMRRFLGRTTAQAALATPLVGTALLLVLGQIDGWLLPGLFLIGLGLALAVMFVVGLTACARARRRLMVSPNSRSG